MFDAERSAITHHYRPRNRNTYITVTANGEVCVRTPIKSEQAVRNLLKSKENWIGEKLKSLLEVHTHRHIPGETLRFRGEIYDVNQFPKLHKKLEKVQKDIDIEKYYNLLAVELNRLLQVNINNGSLSNSGCDQNNDKEI